VAGHLAGDVAAQRAAASACPGVPQPSQHQASTARFRNGTESSTASLMAVCSEASQWASPERGCTAQGTGAGGDALWPPLVFLPFLPAVRRACQPNLLPPPHSKCTLHPWDSLLAGGFCSEGCGCAHVLPTVYTDPFCFLLCLLSSLFTHPLPCPSHHLCSPRVCEGLPHTHTCGRPSYMLLQKKRVR